MDPEIKIESLNFIFPTKHVIPESLKFSNPTMTKIKGLEPPNRCFSIVANTYPK